MKTSQIAERVGLAASTVRAWTREYAPYMSESVQESGARREYTDHDVNLFRYIISLKNSGVDAENIISQLDQLKADDWQNLPDADTEDVPVDDYWRGRVDELRARVAALEVKNDELLKRVGQLELLLKQAKNE